MYSFEPDNKDQAPPPASFNFPATASYASRGLAQSSHMDGRNFAGFPHLPQAQFSTSAIPGFYNWMQHPVSPSRGLYGPRELEYGALAQLGAAMPMDLQALRASAPSRGAAESAHQGGGQPAHGGSLSEQTRHTTDDDERTICDPAEQPQPTNAGLASPTASPRALFSARTDAGVVKGVTFEPGGRQDVHMAEAHANPHVPGSPGNRVKRMATIDEKRPSVTDGTLDPPDGNVRVDPAAALPQPSSIPRDKVKHLLGEEAYHKLRRTMMQQQDAFIEHLWELHRLVHTQSLKAAAAAEEPEALPFEGLALHDSLNRERAAEHVAETLRKIRSMRHLPSSVRAVDNCDALASAAENAAPPASCPRPVPVALGGKATSLEHWLATLRDAPSLGGAQPASPAQPQFAPLSQLGGGSFPNVQSLQGAGNGLGGGLGQLPQGVQMSNMFGMPYMPMNAGDAGLNMFNWMPNLAAPSNPLLMASDPHAAWINKHARNSEFAAARSMNSQEHGLSQIPTFPAMSNSSQHTNATHWWHDPLAVFGSVLPPPPMYDVHRCANMTQSAPDICMPVASHSHGGHTVMTASAILEGGAQEPRAKRKQSAQYRRPGAKSCRGQRSSKRQNVQDDSD